MHSDDSIETVFDTLNTTKLAIDTLDQFLDSTFNSFLTTHNQLSSQ